MPFSNEQTHKSDVMYVGVCGSYANSVSSRASVRGHLNGVAAVLRSSVKTVIRPNSVPFSARLNLSAPKPQFVRPNGSQSHKNKNNERRGGPLAESPNQVRGSVPSPEHGRGGEYRGVEELREHQQDLHPGGKSTLRSRDSTWF